MSDAGQPSNPPGTPGWGQQPPPPGQPPQGTPPQAPPPQPPQGQWGQQPPPPAQPPQGQWGQQPPPPGQPQGVPPQAPPQDQWGGQPAVPQPGQPNQWGGPGPGQTSSGGGLEPNVGAMLAYLLFGWIGGLIMYFTQKHPEVRFHAAQSVMLFGGLHILQIVLSFGLGNSFASLGLFALLGLIISLISFILWIFMSIQGYQLNHLKLPVIGDLAEQWANKPA